MLATLLSAVLLLGSPAHAQDDEDLFNAPPPKKKETEASPTFTDDTDIDIAVAPPPPPKVTAAAAPAPGAKLPLDLAGKAPLGDHFAPTIAHVTAGAVLVDLPVVLSTDAASFSGAAWWLVVEALADGARVAETRTLVQRDSLATGAPSVAWTRLFVPVKQKSGMVELRVGKATAPEAKPAPLLTRSVGYAL